MPSTKTKLKTKRWLLASTLGVGVVLTPLVLGSLQRKKIRGPQLRLNSLFNSKTSKQLTKPTLVNSAFLTTIAGLYGGLSFIWSPMSHVWRWAASSLFAPLATLGKSKGLWTAASLGSLMTLGMSNFVSTNKSFGSIKELRRRNKTGGSLNLKAPNFPRPLVD